MAILARKLLGATHPLTIAHDCFTLPNNDKQWRCLMQMYVAQSRTHTPAAPQSCCPTRCGRRAHRSCGSTGLSNFILGRHAVSCGACMCAGGSRHRPGAGGGRGGGRQQRAPLVRAVLADGAAGLRGHSPHPAVRGVNARHIDEMRGEWHWHPAACVLAAKVGVWRTSLVRQRYRTSVVAGDMHAVHACSWGMPSFFR